jgi:hypothetical protein
MDLLNCSDSFSDPLVVEQITGGIWELHEAFTFTWNGKEITVPEGFKTDFASVPRPFRSVIPKSGKYNQAAVVHDFIYIHQTERFTKKEADLIFLDGMKVLGVKKFKRCIMYIAVKYFGKGNWNHGT